MPANILTDTKYEKLLKDIRRLIQSGRKAATEAANRMLVRTYWEIGKRIHSEELTAYAGYGASIMADLAEDLEMDADTLRKSMIFYLRYEKKSPWALNLSWSTYRALLPIADEKERTFYEQEVLKQGWTSKELIAAIQRGHFKGRGSIRTSDRRKAPLPRPTQSTYVYRAVVQRVVDGDSLILRLDLGFQVWKEQRVRLQHVDAPPVDEAKGYAAFEYVRDQLARVPFVIVRTHKIDIYGRYVGDVFYSFSSTDADEIFKSGRYLNQELLDQGLAKRI